MDFHQLRREAHLCLEAVPGFLDRACADILSYSPKVVGFHVSTSQLMSAIALARRLKAEVPDLAMAMGGPYGTRPMGEAIRDACDVFDVVFSGEADFAFPRFVEELLETGCLPNTNVIDCTPVPDLDVTSQ